MRYVLLTTSLLLVICGCITFHEEPEIEFDPTPSYIEISEIIITEFPENQNSGYPWDLNSDPDISLIIKNKSDSIIAETPILYECKFGEQHALQVDSLIVINNPTEHYSWELIEHDEVLGSYLMRTGLTKFFTGTYVYPIKVQGNQTEILFEAEYFE